MYTKHGFDYIGRVAVINDHPQVLKNLIWVDQNNRRHQIPKAEIRDEVVFSKNNKLLFYQLAHFYHSPHLIVPGDSGSALFVEEDGNHKLVGVIVSGSSEEEYYSPQVRDFLKQVK